MGVSNELSIDFVDWQKSSAAAIGKPNVDEVHVWRTGLVEGRWLIARLELMLSAEERVQSCTAYFLSRQAEVRSRPCGIAADSCRVPRG